MLPARYKSFQFRAEAASGNGPKSSFQAILPVNSVKELPAHRQEALSHNIVVDVEAPTEKKPKINNEIGARVFDRLAGADLLEERHSRDHVPKE